MMAKGVMVVICVVLFVGVLLAVLIRDSRLRMEMNADVLSFSKRVYCNGVAIAAGDCITLFHWFGLVVWIAPQSRRREDQNTGRRQAQGLFSKINKKVSGVQVST